MCVYSIHVSTRLLDVTYHKSVSQTKKLLTYSNLFRLCKSLAPEILFALVRGSIAQNRVDYLSQKTMIYITFLQHSDLRNIDLPTLPIFRPKGQANLFFRHDDDDDDDDDDVDDDIEYDNYF